MHSLHRCRPASVTHRPRPNKPAAGRTPTAGRWPPIAACCLLIALTACLPGDPELESYTDTPAPSATPDATLPPTPAPSGTPLPTPTQVANLACPVTYRLPPDDHAVCVAEVAAPTGEHTAEGLPTGVTFSPGDVLPIDLTVTEQGRCVLRASDRWVACADLRPAPLTEPAPDLPQ